MAGVPLDYSERTIAFLDIVGFQEAIERTRSDRQAFFTVGSALAEIVGQCRSIDIREEYSHQPKNLQAVWFSDTIIITGPPDTSGLRNVLHIALDMYGRLMHAKGLLLRGAVVRGPAYESGGILFGPGIVDAYLLEKKAVYPRIILSNEVVRSLDGPQGKMPGLWSLTTGTSPAWCFRVDRDEDEEWYVDPLTAAAAYITIVPDGIGDPAQEWVRTFRTRAETGEAKFRTNDRYRPKYEWMLRKVRAYEGEKKRGAEG